MPHESSPASPREADSHVPDASDVISGPIGSASLRDPATSGPEGAELDKLPATDVDAGDPSPTGPAQPSA